MRTSHHHKNSGHGILLYTKLCGLPTDDVMHSITLAATPECAQRNTGCPACALDTVASVPACIHQVDQVLDSFTHQHVCCLEADASIRAAKD